MTEDVENSCSCRIYSDMLLNVDLAQLCVKIKVVVRQSVKEIAHITRVNCVNLESYSVITAEKSAP